MLGGGLESEFNHVASDSTRHTYNETPIKALAPDAWGSFLIESLGMQEGDTFRFYGKTAQKTLPVPRPGASSFG